MSEELKLSDVYVNDEEDTENLNKTHYVSVLFENKYSGPKFYGKEYHYRTTTPYQEGQVVSIETKYGKSSVCIINKDVPEKEVEEKMISLGLTLNDVKEI